LLPKQSQKADEEGERRVISFPSFSLERRKYGIFPGGDTGFLGYNLVGLLFHYIYRSIGRLISL